MQALRTVNWMESLPLGLERPPLLRGFPRTGTGSPGAMRSEERVPIPVPMAPPAPAFAQVTFPSTETSNSLVVITIYVSNSKNQYGQDALQVQRWNAHMCAGNEI